MKSLKKILSLLLVICALCVSVFMIASCGGNGDTDTNTNTETESDTNTDDVNPPEDETVVYKVYFQNQNGQPIEGIDAQICAESGLCLQSQISDAEGAMFFEYFQLEPFHVQVNSVPEGYIMPEEDIPFPDGRSTVVVTIQQNQTYTVTAGDMFGHKLANILVELYLKADDSLVDSIITDESGKASFTVSPDEYYAKVKHAYDNGAFKIVADTNVISFERGKNAQVTFTVLDNKIDYTVTAKDENGELLDATIHLYNEKLDLVETKQTDSNGKVVFNVPNGTYYALLEDDTYYANPVEFYKNGAVSGEITSTDVKAGSDKQHPIMLLKDIEIELGAGSKAWYGVFASKGKTVELHSNQVEAFYGGQTKKAQADGRIIFQLKETGIAAFRVDSKVEESVVVPGVIYLLGSQETPYQIEVEDSYTFDEVVVEANGKVYYSFVATKNGTVRIETETENAYITINGNPFKKSVKEGDVVIICFFTKKVSGNETTAPAANIVATLELKETTANYTVTAIIDSQVGASQIVELYKYDGSKYVLVKNATCDANGKYVFEGLVETADYYIKAILNDQYETSEEYIPFGDETELTVHINHKLDGTQKYPFVFNSEGTNETNVTVIAGGEVWYASKYVAGGTISSDNVLAKVEIYTSIGDGAPVLVATLTGDNLSYVLPDGDTTTQILIKVTMTNGEAGTLTLTQTNPPAEEEQE